MCENGDAWDHPLLLRVNFQLYLSAPQTTGTRWTQLGVAGPLLPPGLLGREEGADDVHMCHSV